MQNSLQDLQDRQTIHNSFHHRLCIATASGLKKIDTPLSYISFVYQLPSWQKINAQNISNDGSGVKSSFAGIQTFVFVCEYRVTTQIESRLVANGSKHKDLPYLEDKLLQSESVSHSWPLECGVYEVDSPR